MKKQSKIKTGPYDSLRAYMEAIEIYGNVMKIKEIDQDAYELAGLMYKLVDKHGWLGAPAVVVEKVKIDGNWMKGPIIVNQYGLAAHEAMAVGVPIEEISNDQIENFKTALKLVMDLGEIQPIKPIEVERHQAPAKEIILRGEEINVLDFPFLQSNPGDNGRFINTGNLVLIDPEKGRNVGTYRMQIKGPRKIGINPERKQHGWEFLMRMKERGKKVAQAAVVLGTDPIVFAMSSSKTARLGQDELEIAGGFKGKPVEVVKCENSDNTVPAHVEMIIEGEIPLNDLEKEGPFGEMYGYIGELQKENFVMNVQTITHRNNPIIPNQFTGITRGCLTAPIEANLNRKYRSEFDEFIGLHYPLEFPGFCFVKIKKTSTNKTFDIGRTISMSLKIAKITVLFDEDVDIHNFNQVLHALGSRWQPQRSSEMIDNANGLSGDPSSLERGMGSRIIIDATRNATESQTDKPFSKMNIACLREEFPNLLETIEEKFKEII